MRNPTNSGNPTALVILPTRELAEQVENVAHKYLSKCGLHSVLTVGGVPRNGQLQKIRRGVNLVIATPGRLNDFIEGGDLDFVANFSCADLVLVNSKDPNTVEISQIKFQTSK